MDAAPKPQASRRFKIVLAVSLALNLLFVGLVAGAFWRHGGGPGTRGSGPGLQSYAAPYVHALPRSERQQIDRSIRAAHPKLGRAARRAVYEEMLAALRADPFDVTKIEAVLEGQRKAVLGVQQAAQAEWLAAIRRMSGAERAAYADRLQERIERADRYRGQKRRRAED